MSKPSGTTPVNRISRDSGICCEDGDQHQSQSSPASSSLASSAVKKRFPAGGGGGGAAGRTPKTASSYVRRLTQHFEYLTTCSSSDECDRSSPTTTTTTSSSHFLTIERTQQQQKPAYHHSDWNLRLSKAVEEEETKEEEEVAKEEERVPVAEVEQPAEPEESVDEKCDSKEVIMDEAVQVIQNIYEDVLKKDQYHAQRSVNLLISEYDQPVQEVENDRSSGQFEEDEFHNDSDVHFGEEPCESSQPIEAQNSLVSQRASHFGGHHHHDHYDDSDFSDTDSFDSTDDERYEEQQDEERILVSSRPDSNTSLQSERTTNIMRELLENEENYVQTLERGIENYLSVMHSKDLPIGLKGLRYHIFGNIERIHQFHRDSFLPRLRQNQASIQGIAETFIKFIEDDRFYCYIMFALNRPKSERICEKNRDFFQEIQHQCGDKLGLNSFLLQPIQRLPRYKLLLAEINKEVLKMISENLMDSVKNEIGVLCKAEKRLEKFIDVLNQAMSLNDIRECYELNLYQQGKFRKMFEMDIYDWDRRRRYPGKVFFFDKCIIYTEKMKDYLEYRGHYVDAEVGLYNDGKSKLCVFAKKRGIQEVEFSASDMGVVQNMAAYIESVMRGYATQERQRINDLSRKKDWKDQRIPSVMIINRGSAISNRSTLSVASSEGSRESHEPVSQTIWYVQL